MIVIFDLVSPQPQLISSDINIQEIFQPQQKGPTQIKGRSDRANTTTKREIFTKSHLYVFVDKKSWFEMIFSVNIADRHENHSAMTMQCFPSPLTEVITPIGATSAKHTSSPHPPGSLQPYHRIIP